jgi:hypothetical protein
LIYSKFESIIQHPGNKLRQQATTSLHTGILINLNQPNPPISTDKIIQSKQLKAVPPPIAIDLPLDTTKSHVGDFLDFVPNLRDLLLRHVEGELFEGELVAGLELAVGGGVLLDGVVG